MKKLLISTSLAFTLATNANAFVGEIVLGITEIVMEHAASHVFETDEEREVKKSQAQQSAENLKKFFTSEDSKKTELEKVQDEYEKTKHQKNENESTFIKVIEDSSKEAEKQHQKNVQEILGY